MTDTSAILGRFGEGWPAHLAIGPGWTSIVVNLDATLAGIDPDYRIHQVKQKFGGLRFYCTNSGSAEFQAAIAEAEQQAARTCEVCGEPGQLRSRRGWLLTRCDEHAPDGGE